MESFYAAQEIGCVGVETDVTVDVNGVPILFHDRTVDDTLVLGQSRKQLSQIVGYEVPALSHFMEAFNCTFEMNLEIKHPIAVLGTLDVIKEYPNTKIVLTSKHHSTAERMQKLTDRKCGPVMSCVPSNLPSFKPDVFSWNYDCFDPEYKDRCIVGYVADHMVYNVGREEVDLDFIDVIITDYPDYFSGQTRNY
jgi:hypothetical protein